MNAKTFDPAVLDHFTCSDEFYRHPICRNVIYTQGVQYVAESACAYWLLDKMATLQMDPFVAAEEFQVWELFVKDETARLVCGDGNGKEVYREEIEYTDFPAEHVKFYFENSTICLPAER
jgi:hypothetical protein